MADGARATRREFLSAGLGSLATTAAACSGSPPPDQAAPRAGRSTVRTLGRTGLQLPVVSIGSANDPDLLRAALDAGLVYLHTSGSYAEGNHERTLGGVLRGRPRDSFVIGSSPDLPYRWKGGGRSEDLGTGADPSRIGAYLDVCLERLGLPYLDIYYLASINERATVLHEPYMKVFEALKRSGRIRFTGIATHRNEPDVIRAVAQSGFWDVVLTAYNFRQSHRGQVRAAIREAAAAGVGVLAMKTQAGVYWDAFRLRKINMKAALKWVLQDEHVCSAIPAFANHDELREDLEVMRELALTPEEERDLRAGGLPGHLGLYCQQCARCVDQCPSRVDLPLLMRSYMYAVGYGQPQRARAVLSGLAPGEVACARCDHCRVRCALGFDLRARAVEMARLAGAAPAPDAVRRLG
jgi:predicted aldo/keto reductase-like oxidoreductase